MGGDGAAERVGFCVCGEAGEGFGEARARGEEGGVGGYFWGGGVGGFDLWEGGFG